MCNGVCVSVGMYVCVFMCMWVGLMCVFCWKGIYAGKISHEIMFKLRLSCTPFFDDLGRATV